MFSALQKVKSTEDGPLGPGSDLLAALLGTFVLLAVSEKEGLGIRPNQITMINLVSAEFKAKIDTISDGKVYKIYGGDLKHDTIVVQNDATLQHFYFGGNILFETRDATLKPAGQQVVQKIGTAIRKNLSFFKEIQIEGHADIVNTEEFNLNLAAQRAITVFGEFKNQGIDPYENLMSVTSFGLYKPVTRGYGHWGRKENNDANESPGERERNRRIEIILNYKSSLPIKK